MLERVIENWLNNVTERSFENSFCHMLAYQGYTVLHKTRHTGLEMGKDVIAVAEDGVPCVFQLKTAVNGTIKQRYWTDNIQNQVITMINTKPIHPALKDYSHHRSYFVTNGKIEEEVTRQIDDLNRRFEAQGCNHEKLEVIVKGQLLAWAKELETNLWPSELTDVQLLLELFLEDGKDVLNKAKLSRLLEACVNFETPPNRQESKRTVSSLALLNALAVSNYSNSENYVAEIEAWMIYTSYLFAYAEKWKIGKKIWSEEFNIAKNYIGQLLGELYKEVKSSEFYIEGDPSTEPFVIYSIRITYLISFMSIFSLWAEHENFDDNEEINEFCREFCLKNKDYMLLWGEAAVPQYLSFYLYYSKIDATPAPSNFLLGAIGQIIALNKPKNLPKQENVFRRKEHLYLPQNDGIANAYYNSNELLPYLLGINDQPIEDHFLERSQTLWALIEIYVRLNFQGPVFMFWKDATYISEIEFKPKYKWHFFRWKNDEGEVMEEQKNGQKWSELRKQVQEVNYRNIPEQFKKEPILFLLFLCVYPHRISTSVVKWLDSEIRGHETD